MLLGWATRLQGLLPQGCCCCWVAGLHKAGLGCCCCWATRLLLSQGWVAVAQGLLLATQLGCTSVGLLRCHNTRLPHTRLTVAALLAWLQGWVAAQPWATSYTRLQGCTVAKAGWVRCCWPLRPRLLHKADIGAAAAGCCCWVAAQGWAAGLLLLLRLAHKAGHKVAGCTRLLVAAAARAGLLLLGWAAARLPRLGCWALRLGCRWAAGLGLLALPRLPVCWVAAATRRCRALLLLLLLLLPRLPLLSHAKVAAAGLLLLGCYTRRLLLGCWAATIGCCCRCCCYKRCHKAGLHTITHRN
ncbi:hypothetical protein ACI2OX_22170, partial [Bacillus sp. N9]